MKFRIGVALSVGVFIATVATIWPRPGMSSFYVELTIRSALPGFAQLYYDLGSGVGEPRSGRLPIQGGNTDVVYKFPIPDGRYANLKFEPTNRASNTISLSDARIVDRNGYVMRQIEPNQLKALQGIERLEVSPATVNFTTSPASERSILVVELGQPLILKSYGNASARTLGRRFLVALLLSSAAALLATSLLPSGTSTAARRWGTELTVWFRTHPLQILFATAAVAVVLSCYPIVFFARSFLSPNNHTHSFLLYGEMPTVPGYANAVTDNEKGSDLGAALWYSWPTSVAESRSLFKDFELPLWNRYDSCGLPLLGQGQSMFGDPLHFLVLLTHGAVGWWDLKYLLAKFLFASCLGLCVLQLTRHLPAALIITASATFIGFFCYRYTHPAFFSLCYAPAVLLCWFKLIDARERRATAAWLGAMALANWSLMSSGTVKDAYVLLLAMNFAGCLSLLLAGSVARKRVKLFQAILAQLLFVVIAAPIWMTFLSTLRASWTVYGAGAVFQLQPGLLLGLFDDIFYRQFNANNNFDPSANFLVLGGVLWFCLDGRQNDNRKLSWGLGITCLLALAFTFGIIPPSLITRFPFLRNIHHVDNAFSCVALVCLLVLAGFGLKAFWNDCGAPDFRRSYFRVLTCLAALLALYLGTTEAADRSARAFLPGGDHIPKSTFFWWYATLLVIALAAAPWIGRRILRANRISSWQICSLALIFVLLHWRHGMHLITPFDAYVMNPQPRMQRTANSSAAVEIIRSRATEPSRSAGLDYNFFPGYGGAIGVEQIDSAAPLLNKHYRALMSAYGARLPYSSDNEGMIGDQLEKDLPLFEMLNVRYFLGYAGTRIAALPSLKKIAALDLDVYESTKVWPRAFFSDRLIAYDAEQDFVRLLKTGSGLPFAAVAKEELESQPELPGLASNPSGTATAVIVSATHYALTSNTTSFKVTAPGPGVVVLTEPDVAGDFQLKVNGKASSYFRVNSAFRGVFIPGPGEYDFSFRYWPRYFTISLWLGGLGILFLGLWLGMLVRNSTHCD